MTASNTLPNEPRFYIQSEKPLGESRCWWIVDRQKTGGTLAYRGKVSPFYDYKRQAVAELKRKELNAD